MVSQVSGHFRKASQVKCKLTTLLLILVTFAATTACRRTTDQAKAATITLYGFSVLREPLEGAIIPAFQAEWRKKTGQEISFDTSYAGSEIVTNQIIAGVEAEVAILAIDRNADRLVQPRVTSHEWRKLPYGGIVNKTPMIIIVRQGNPKRIRDFSDLAQPGLKLLHCDPVSSGAGQWSLLAIYGSTLLNSERQTGARDEQKAEDLLRRIWKNVISTPSSAREARTQFERGEGDALVTYEIEGLQLLAKKVPAELVFPPATIFSEHPVVIIDHIMSPQKYALVEVFVRSLWDRPAQEAWVKSHLRSVTDEKLNEKFTKIAAPFYAANLGGWDKAYPQIVEGVWKQRVQTVRQ
jgi:sulfate/thiosulfate transport system substrate-binding protein